MNKLIKNRSLFVFKDSFKTVEAHLVGARIRFVSNDSKSDVVKSEPKFPSIGSIALKRGTGGRSSFNGTVCTVFGANGFIGLRVVNRLGKIGSQIIVPFRRDPYYSRDLKLAGDLGQVLFVPYYLRNAESIYKAVKYSNVVINLVGQDNETASFKYDEVHVEGARLIAKIAKEAGVQRFIHISALNCSPNPKATILKNGSNFLRSKYYGEEAVKEEFPEATIFRPADVFGDGDRFLMYYSGDFRKEFMKDTVLWNKGKGVFKQPVYANNLAEGIVNSIYDNEAPGKTYDAIGPKRHELRDIVDYINRITQYDDTFDYKVKELKYAPLFWTKVLWAEHFRKNPPEGVCFDRIERETVTDETTPGNPTLEDLGVNLTSLEDRAYGILKFVRRLNYYQEEIDEFPVPPPPKVYA